MPVDDSELCSRSLVILGAQPLTSLADDLSDNATTCRTVYPGLRDMILSDYPWRCALRRKALTRDATSPFADGRWNYSFQLPSDRLSGGAFAAFRTGNLLSRPFNEWTIIGDRLVTDAETVWVEYPKQLTEPDFPAYLVSFLVAALCADIALAVTDQQNTADHWRKVAYGTDPDATGGLELRAQIADAQQHPAQAFESEETFDLIDARF